MNNMAKIPFIVHKEKMYKEQRKLKSLLLVTNLVWLTVVLFLIMR